MALENLTPIIREEAFLNEIATGEFNMDPVTREEAFLKMIAVRKAGEEFPDIDPVTRREYFLKKIADSFSGGGDVEMESGVMQLAEDSTTPSIQFSNTHDTLPNFAFVILDTHEDGTYPTNQVATCFYYCDLENIGYAKNNASNSLYGVGGYAYFNSSYTTQAYAIKHSMSSATSNSNMYPRYYVNESGITCHTQLSNPYRNGLKYRWVAIWL